MAEVDHLLKVYADTLEVKHSIEHRINAMFEGKRVHILDRSYNGQWYGKSKPCLFDKIRVVQYAQIWKGEVSLHLIGCDAPITLNKVRVLL